MSGLSAIASSGAAQAQAELAATLRRSTVEVRAARSGGGSGVIWRADGVIVTNAHVARGKRLAVELADGSRFGAELTARDDDRDIAALQVDAKNLAAAVIGDSDVVKPGHLAFAVGNPLGLRGAVTSGIVFAAGAAGNRRARWIQADVRIAPGNSGGPLADASGRVIGINSMIYSGLAIAVPSNTVSRFLRAQGGQPRLGVTVEPVRLRGDGGAAGLGLMIFEVAGGSAAERGGVLPGDVIVRIGDATLRAPDDLPDALIDAGSDGTVALSLLRGGSVIERAIALDHRTGANAAA